MTNKLAALGAAFLLSSCAIVTKQPTPGFLYSDTQFNDSVTSNQAGNRVGEACSTSILGAVSTGDSSVEAARRNGGITMITSVDGKATSYLGVYAKYCTIVRGR